MKFSPKPTPAISLVEIFSVPKTMAFGAVATGSINAQLALKAAGIINNLGSVAVAMAVAARIGMRSVVVAVLLVISVKKVTNKQIKAIINKG